MGQAPKRERCPPGALAWQQYHVTLQSGRAVTLALSLADPCNSTMSRVIKDHHALHLGLLVILDDPGSIEEVVLWLHQSASLELVSQNGDTFISDEIRAILPRYFAAFFDEIRDLVPDLAGVTLEAIAGRPRNDRNLH